MTESQCPSLVMNYTQCDYDLTLAEATDDTDVELLEVFDSRRAINIVAYSLLSAGEITVEI